MAENMLLINSQWQGGGNIATMRGAEEIEKFYLSNTPHISAQVSPEPSESTMEHEIIAYRVIRRQMEAVSAQIAAESPERMFTIGGSCDADIPSIAYMNELLRGEMTLLWMDAHADINLPSESPTKLFYGMPVRALMGEMDDLFPGLIRRSLNPAQLINVGGRDFDPGERSFMAQNSVKRISVSELAESPESLLKAVHHAGEHKLYVHLDLDCLDPKDFPDTAVPIPNGLPAADLMPLLRLLKENCSIAAFSLYENLPVGHRVDLLSQIVDFGLSVIA